MIIIPLYKWGTLDLESQRSPCCDKIGLKKGPWTPEEDQKLLAYVEEHGHGSWRSLPEKAGLQRCGKSCRLRWTNYLRPDIKRGKFTLQEEQTIIQLHALLGNRWSAIATHLPKRTDNEIKNYWNTHLKKRLVKMGIDPITHKPQNETLLSSGGQSKNAAMLSHMAQWESARLEAEARLVRESKLLHLQHYQENLNKSAHFDSADQRHEESPTSSENVLTPSMPLGIPSRNKDNNEDNESSSGIPAMIEFVGSSSGNGLIEEDEHDWTIEMNCAMEGIEEGFTSLLLSDSFDRSFTFAGKNDAVVGNDGSCGSDYNYYGNYWNSILHLVNFSPFDSPTMS